MKSLAICIISILFASITWAQLPTGTILGQVKDPSGAAMPGARISIRNTDTNQTRTGVTGEDGEYRLQTLPVGNYEITEEASGFRTEVRTSHPMSGFRAQK